MYTRMWSVVERLEKSPVPVKNISMNCWTLGDPSQVELTISISMGEENSPSSKEAVIKYWLGKGKLCEQYEQKNLNQLPTHSNHMTSTKNVDTHMTYQNALEFY